MTAAGCKVLLITGASRGIGAATARLAATRGYAVCVNYRPTVTRHRPSSGTSKPPAQGLAVAADVGVETDVVRLFDECTSSLGPLTALVNNAGILETADARGRHGRGDGCIASSPPTSSARFSAPVKPCSACPSNTAGGAEPSSNITSGAARHGSAGEYVDYAASKGAIDTLTIGLAREVAEEAIRVKRGPRRVHLHGDPRQRRRTEPGGSRSRRRSR
jgi:NAD(P)-dependent dehydrogenase (short-subunit alcohol dehydrogenase family)